MLMDVDCHQNCWKLLQFTVKTSFAVTGAYGFHGNHPSFQMFLQILPKDVGAF